MCKTLVAISMALRNCKNCGRRGKDDEVKKGRVVAKVEL